MLLRELRFALRRLGREPGFAAAAVVTLALGLGVNAALFALARDILAPHLPVSQAEDLVVLRPRMQPPAGEANQLDAFSYPMYQALREAVSEPTTLAAYKPQRLAFSFGAAGSGAAARLLRAEIVSASYLEVLGVAPALGRGIGPAEDDGPAAAAVVLLGDGLWREAFGADPQILGRTVSIEKQPFTVIGVLPRGFRGVSRQAEAWVPMASAPALTFSRRLTGTLSFWHHVIARAPGESRSRFAVELAAAARAVEERIPLSEAFGSVELSFTVVPLLEAERDPSADRAVILLFGATVGVLLVASVNVGGLFMVRAAARGRESAVRAALGAASGDRWRRALAESALIGGLGAAAGWALAPLPLALARRFQPGGGSFPSGGPDAWSAGYIALAAGASALICVALGVAGERFAARSVALAQSMGTSADRHAVKLRSLIVAVQLALVLVVAFGAGQFARGLFRLYDRPLGFAPEGVASLRLSPPRAAYTEERAAAFFEQAVGRLGALPGARLTTVANCLPLTGMCDQVQLRIEGREQAPGEPGRDVWLNMVGPSYFTALGIPVLRGRAFEARDVDGAPRVAIVDREAARRYWPDSDPLGARIQLSNGTDWAEVVGIVESVTGASLQEERAAGVYISFAQFAYRGNFLVLQTASDEGALLAAAERAVHELDPDLAVWDISTMSQLVHRAGSRPRFGAALLAAFGALASVLAALGIYGVTSFMVTRRRREFGVRLAVGARGADLGRGVLTDGLRLAAASVAGGALAAWAVGRWMAAHLADVPSGGAGLLALAALWVVFVVLSASLVPARRAARVDPASVLREE